MRRAVFMDRDGTLCKNGPYLKEAEKLRVYAATAKALRVLQQAGFKRIVVTNQSGIARGLMSPRDVYKIHERFQRILRGRGAAMNAFYFCPHPPAQKCSCRKPAPGMLQRGARRFGVSLKDSFMVGDRESDLEMAARAGMRCVLVLSGGGHKTHQRIKRGIVTADHVAKNIFEAARWIVKQG